MLGTVGIKVGNTTPLALENQDMIPPVSPIRGAAVLLFIKEARISLKSWIPPRVWVMFISTLTPPINSKVLQGIILIAFFSSAAPSRMRIRARVRQTSPTSKENPTTSTTITRMAARLRSCFPSNFSIFLSLAPGALRILYPPKTT